ncbi:hypothetical protein MUK42_12566 [Musa troglodytarum]|uniref:Uncharacterized protein n=1 Tax=Musa troglodytarum TaxID=320322 RepID=A0A9E7HLD5_9LILI|nr:hypothetical protein MUK42_12566 [Musa troglodytarum]
MRALPEDEESGMQPRMTCRHKLEEECLHLQVAGKLHRKAEQWEIKQKTVGDHTSKECRESNAAKDDLPAHAGRRVPSLQVVGKRNWRTLTVPQPFSIHRPMDDIKTSIIL